MVDTDESGFVRDIQIKPATTSLKRAWAIAVWRGAFTEFLHSFVEQQGTPDEHDTEVFLGHVFQTAIGGGMRVQAINVSDEPFVDIGTWEGLADAARFFRREVDNP